MGAAAEDLGGIAGCAVALGLLYILLALTTAVFAVVDNIGALGFYPFRSASRVIDAAITNALNSAIKTVERLMANFLSGLADSLAVLLGLALIVLILVKDALAYMWNHSLPGFLADKLLTIRTEASSALAKVTTLTDTVADNLTEAETYARTHAADAARDALSVLRPEIAAAKNAATEYADDAVAKLRSAEDAAVDNAVSLASAAATAGVNAARGAATEAEGIAAAALAASEAAASTALAGVKAIAVDVEHELDVIKAARDAAGVAALIAAIPALGTLLHTIATESGLENQECRSKVKDICGTDPSAWTGLLAGLAALGVAFSLRELVDIAKPIVAELEPIVSAIGR